MTNILLSGCNGRMGQVISNIAKTSSDYCIACGFDLNDSIKNDYPVFNKLSDCNVKVDAIIDFSSPLALKNVADHAVSSKTPVVVATTGLTSEHINILKDASLMTPVFFSANMSLGISVLIDLVKKASKVLESNFDIEIIEKHHNQKVDAPSGTALKIADAVNSVLETKDEYVYDRHLKSEKRSKHEIGIHAVRGGTIAGEHSVLFAGMDEILEIKHTALSRDIFAVGALKAAAFISDKKPGMYEMDDIVAEK